MKDQVAEIGATKISCVAEVLRRRLAKYPLPTPESYVDEHLIAELEDDLPDLLCITVPMPSRKRGVASLRIGLVLTYLFGTPLDLSVVADIERHSGHSDFSCVLIPVCGAVDGEIVRRSSSLKHIRVIEIPQPRFSRDFSTTVFEFIAAFPPGVVNEANVIADHIIRNLRKVSHILLSDTAAEEYDTKYKYASAGTAFAMEREEELLAKLVDGLDETRGLIELGCGTGRHSLRLAERFQRVFGYDFSPSMIDVANKNRRTLRTRGGAKVRDMRVEFAVLDVEMFPPKRQANIPIDLIIGLFGMGSFVEDLPRALFDWWAVLEHGGRIALSFYNRDALTYAFPPPWRHTSLSATLDSHRQELKVQLPSGQTFLIFCKPYTVKELMVVLSLYFVDVEIFSFPVISGILPPEYVGHVGDANFRKIQEITSDIDRTISSKERGLGNYFFATGRKPRLAPRMLFDNLVGDFTPENYQALLRATDNKFEMFEHPPTKTAAGIDRAMTAGAPYLKAILAFVGRPERSPNLNPVVFVIGADRRLDRQKAAGAIGSKTGDWRLADKQEIIEIFGHDDFPLPVVGLGTGVSIVIDSELELGDSWWASGGSPTSSLRFSGIPPSLREAKVAPIVTERRVKT